MQFPEKIKTIKKTGEFRFKEKGSLFIGYAAPCSSIEDADEILNEKKKEFYDATHNCYAYKLIGDQIKYSDDGEPSGTAGIRILNAIQHFDLVNLIVISTRYFGGTKLGVGPLGKAYYNSANGVLEEIMKITKVNYSMYELHYEFDFTKSAHHFLNLYNCIIQESTFKTRPIISFLIKPADIESFKKDIKNASRDSCTLVKVRENLYLERN